MSKPYHDRDTLLETYRELGTQKEVAEKFNVCETTIRKWIAKYDIPTSRNDTKPYHNRETLKEAYEELGTIKLVAEEFGVSTTTIGNWLRKYNLITPRWEQPDEESVREAYEELGTQTEVAKRFNVDITTVVRWMKRYDIPVVYETLDSTPERPYRGGWGKIADKIRDRDTVCRRCGIDPEQTLQVHHIVPVREFETHKKAHDSNNLVALCPTCHAKMERLTEAEQREMI